MMMVVAALIECDGKLLACQRRRGSKFELMWEFPGGKTEPGESLEQALARELREELGVTARIDAEIYRVRHKYPEMKDGIELVFFAVSVNPAEVKNLDFEQIVWREPASLPELNFLPADRELIDKLANGSLRLPQI
jgi:8-oxo-dGTP diphosphatase